MVCVWRSEDHVCIGIASLLPMGSRDSTQVFRLGCKCPYLLSHLAGSAIAPSALAILFILLVASLQWWGWTQGCVHSSRQVLYHWAAFLLDHFSEYMVLTYLAFSFIQPSPPQHPIHKIPFLTISIRRVLSTPLSCLFIQYNTDNNCWLIIHFPHKNINSTSRRCCSKLLLHLIKTWYRAGQIFSIHLLNNEWTFWF